jgi:hypothetical protein
MEQIDSVWSWSESFLTSLEGLMREPQSYGAVRLDWPWRREWLGSWRRQVDAGREQYQQGHPEALRVLYDYWRTVADDVREQARFASETYRQFQRRA